MIYIKEKIMNVTKPSISESLVYCYSPASEKSDYITNRALNMSTLITLVIILLSSAPLFAQLNAPIETDVFELLGSSENITDSRCAALGHNTTIAPSGVASLFYNPGRLARIPSIQGSAGLRAHWGSFGEDVPSIFGSDEHGEYPFHVKINHLALAMPIPPARGDLQVVVGAGYRTVWDRGYKQKITDDLWGDNTREIVSKGGYSVVTGGFAMDYKRQIGIGASMSIPFWSSLKIEEEIVQNSDISGSFLMLGGYAEMTDGVNIGLTWRQGVDIKFENEFELATYLIKTDQTVTYPAIYSLGGEYRPSESFAVMVEYQTRLFSEVEVVSQMVPSDGNIWVDQDILHDGSAMKVGIDLGGVQLGAYSESIFVPDEIHDQEPDSRQPTTLTGYTVGIGSNSVHLSFEYRSYSAQTEEFNSEWREELYMLRLTVNQMFD